MGHGALYNLPEVWQVAQVRLDGWGFAVMLGTTYEGMAMTLAMTPRAQCDAIGHVVSQFRVFCEGLDVMWMKLYCFATFFVVVSATVLASVVVALKDRFSPFCIFNPTPGDVILMRAVGMVFPSGFVGFLSLLASCGMGQLVASWRAVFAEIATFNVFGHWFATNGAGDLYLLAIGADLVIVVFVFLTFISLATHFASYTNATGVGCDFGCAGQAGISRSWLVVYGYCRDWFAAHRARLRGLCNALIANGIVLFLTAFSTVHLTHNEHSTTVARSWQVGGV